MWIRDFVAEPEMMFVIMEKLQARLSGKRLVKNKFSERFSNVNTRFCGWNWSIGYWGKIALKNAFLGFENKQKKFKIKLDLSRKNHINDSSAEGWAFWCFFFRVKSSSWGFWTQFQPIILLRKIYDFQYISKILRGVSILMLHHPETIVVCWLIYC